MKAETLIAALSHSEPFRVEDKRPERDYIVVTHRASGEHFSIPVRDGWVEDSDVSKAVETMGDIHVRNG